MANKNTAGNVFRNFKAREKRLIADMDRREKNGKNKENVDDTFRNFRYMTAGGERVWSF